MNTMPEGTLKALAERRRCRGDDAGGWRRLANRCWRGSPGRGSTSSALAVQLQDEGAKSFVNSWNDLMDVIGSKSAVLKRAS